MEKPGDPRTRPSGWVATAAFVVSCGEIALWGPIDWGPYLLALGLALGLQAARRALAARRRGEPFWAGSGLYLAPAALLVVFGGNALLDSSPVVPHLTVVQSKWWIGGRRIRVRSWRPGESAVGVTVARAQFAALSEGSPVIVESRAGAFGWEWVTAVRGP